MAAGCPATTVANNLRAVRFWRRVQVEMVERRNAGAALLEVLRSAGSHRCCPTSGQDKCRAAGRQCRTGRRAEGEIVADQLRGLGRIGRPIAESIALAGRGRRWRTGLRLSQPDRLRHRGQSHGPAPHRRTSLIPVDFCLLVNDRIGQLHATWKWTIQSSQASGSAGRGQRRRAHPDETAAGSDRGSGDRDRPARGRRCRAAVSSR
jgi:hypothetical protein